MESTVRNVREIASDERRVYETVLGQRLTENQQVVLQVIDLGESSTEEGAEESNVPPAGPLPEWCRVYEGLTEQQIAEIEHVVLTRSDMTRPSP
jgi:hypothetical protein